MDVRDAAEGLALVFVRAAVLSAVFVAVSTVIAGNSFSLLGSGRAVALTAAALTMLTLVAFAAARRYRPGLLDTAEAVQEAANEQGP